MREKMETTEIVETLKTQYNRDLRKQVVKTIQKNEQETERPNYQIINQIFTYVQKELNWKLPENTEEWDYTPLDIMKEVFPHIESTKWYDTQILTAKKMIDAIKKGQRR
ncbi:hypothetical protein [Sulfurovum sp.]|jgi:hypothetical protein|uniref:hypothetical protein n=1 Tax=Sulfurovum sp. TaxID=1969726 RepID=UPI003C763C9B